MSTLVNDAIALYMNTLRQIITKHYDGDKVLEYVDGRRYVKLIVTDVPGRGYNRSVHSFIDKKTADLYKPASWAAPAKHVRYNLVRDWHLLEPQIDPYGSYLYMK